MRLLHQTEIAHTGTHATMVIFLALPFSVLNVLCNEAAIYNHAQGIEQNQSLQRFVQLLMTDVDQRKLEAQSRVSRTCKAASPY